jgi:hypothetical protein
MTDFHSYAHKTSFFLKNKSNWKQNTKYWINFTQNFTISTLCFLLCISNMAAQFFCNSVRVVDIRTGYLYRRFPGFTQFLHTNDGAFGRTATSFGTLCKEFADHCHYSLFTLTFHSSLITINNHCSIFTNRCSLFNIHCSLLTNHCSLFTQYSLLCTNNQSLFTNHFSIFTIHCSLITNRCYMFAIHRSLFTNHWSLFTNH